jgi:hypothetical protein
VASDGNKLGEEETRKSITRSDISVALNHVCLMQCTNVFSQHHEGKVGRVNRKEKGKKRTKPYQILLLRNNPCEH